MKMAVFRDVVLTDFADELTASIITMMIKAVSSSETSVSIYHITLCYSSENSHLYLFVSDFVIKIVYVCFVSQTSGSVYHNTSLKTFNFFPPLLMFQQLILDQSHRD
jgi:hypothetical protein